MIGRRQHIHIAVLTLGILLWGMLATAVISRTNPSRQIAGFKPGTRNPLVSGMGANGKSISTDHGQPLILYVFSPTCSWCKQNHQNITALFAQLQSKYRFVSVSLMNDTAPDTYKVAMRDYLATSPVPGDLMFVDPMQLDDIVRRDIRTFPQLLVVKADGVIERTWVGALMSNRKSDVERYFGVRLPGLGGAEP